MQYGCLFLYSWLMQTDCVSGWLPQRGFGDSAHMSMLIDQNYTGTWDFPRLIFPPVLSSLSVLHRYKIAQRYTVSQLSKKDGLERGHTFRNSLIFNKIIFKFTLSWVFSVTGANQCQYITAPDADMEWTWKFVALSCVYLVWSLYLYTKLWTTEKKFRQNEREHSWIAQSSS